MENKDHKIQKIHKIAFIYCIKSYQTEDIYIGSSAQRLSKRLSQHRSDYKKYLNGKHGYVSSFEIVKYEDCYIEMIETLNDVNKMEMEKIEGTYIKNTDCVNKRIEGRTIKEWTEDNKEKISEYTKQYYKDNKEQIIEHQKQYYNDNKQQIIEHQKQYYQDNKEYISEQAKKYYNDNKEKISEYTKQYYNDNKQQIIEHHKQYYQDNKEKLIEKHNCICGGKYTLQKKARHEKTQKHLNYIKK